MWLKLPVTNSFLAKIVRAIPNLTAASVGGWVPLCHRGRQGLDHIKPFPVGLKVAAIAGRVKAGIAVPFGA